MSTEQPPAGTEVGTFIERALREMSEEAERRLAALDADEAQLRVTIELAESLKPELAVEANQMVLRVQRERQTIRDALARLGAKSPEPPRNPEPPRPEPQPAVAPAPASQPRPVVPEGYLREVEALTGRVRALEANPVWDDSLYYELRRAVASVRDLIARGRSHKATQTVAFLETLLEDVYAWYSGVGRPGGFVYGFSREHHGGAGWGYLERAYEALEAAERAVAVLQSSGGKCARSGELVAMAQRAQLLFRRVVNKHGMSLAEPRQELVRDAMKELGAPYQELSDLDAALESLRHLPAALAEAERAAAPADRSAALDALEEAAGSGELANLVRLTAAALEAGVPPSDLRLRAALAPHAGSLSGAGGGGQFARLVEYLESDARERGAAGGEGEGPADPAEDLGEEEYQRMLAAVRGALSGKRVLFMGGTRDPEKAAAIERELGLLELDWPSTSPTTKLGFFLERVPRADAVFRLSRFSRKAYKEASAEAKRQGKICVTVAGGLGLHNIVRQVHEQLSPRAR